MMPILFEMSWLDSSTYWCFSGIANYVVAHIKFTTAITSSAWSMLYCASSMRFTDLRQWVQWGTCRPLEKRTDINSKLHDKYSLISSNVQGLLISNRCIPFIRTVLIGFRIFASKIKYCSSCRYSWFKELQRLCQSYFGLMSMIIQLIKTTMANLNIMFKAVQNNSLNALSDIMQRRISSWRRL